LPPGYLLEFSQGRVHLQKYWDLPQFDNCKSISENECLEELEYRLGEAVKIRLISDVPIGALLSGGVDSSTVVALMSKYSATPVKTFTIKFPNDDFDETGYARLVARQFNTEHHEFMVEPNFGEILRKLTELLEEPFADSSIVPTYCVSRLAREHVTVALAGDGGDELFAGYDRYQINMQRRGIDFIPNWAGYVYRRYIFRHLPETTYGRRFLYTMSLPRNQRYLHEISFFHPDGSEESIFSSQFLSFAKDYKSPLNLFQEYLEAAPASVELSKLQYLDVKTYLPGDILAKVDRMSMASSLEVRAPILDHLFAEWVTQLSSSWKMRGGERKYILKKLAERLGVPRSAIYRPKQGFAVPLVHWFRKELKRELLDILLEPRTLQRGYFDASAVRRLLNEHLCGRRDRSSDIWILLIFELWHRNFLEALPFSAKNTDPQIGSMALSAAKRFS
jgi:asparagine synthase (glutamine-hydrolysing)